MILGILAFEDAGFIIGSYVITFGVIAGFTWRVMRGGRQLADHIDDDDKYWT